jgi:hypothetical protein
MWFGEINTTGKTSVNVFEEQYSALTDILHLLTADVNYTDLQIKLLL